MTSFLRHLFPPLRHRFSWWSIVPLVVFLIALVAGVVICESMRRVTFVNRWGFAILIVAPWIWWMSLAGTGGLHRIRNWIALISRLLMLGILALILADPRSVRESNKLSVVYVVDISDSIGDDSVDRAIDFVLSTTLGKEAEDEAGLIVFGREAAVELPPRVTFPFEALNSRVRRDATDVARSLSLAAAMLPEENMGRIVLVSDGMENAGALDPVLEDLRARDISVDVLPISYEYDTEVWLERLDLPKFVKLGESYEASVVLTSLKAGSGTLVLQENGRTISEQEVSYGAGKNRFTIPLYLREAGYYEYTATLQTEKEQDHIRENNTVMNHLFIEGEGRVLVLTDPTGDSRHSETLVADLKGSERIVDTKSAYGFPRDPLALLPYDAIVMANVPADALDALQMKAIHDVVEKMGVGLLMIGGENSFGPGGYKGSDIEKALPVEMDVSQKKILPKAALAIILHTCEFPQGNTHGKEITKKAIQVLSDQDEVGVLVYSAGEEWLFELTPRSEYPMMAQKINGASIGDMPSFSTTMQLGLNGLVASDAATKHMIIISDGDATPPPPQLVAQFQREKVSVSMVAIFPHGGQDISKMRAIANTTGGRYYFPESASELPSIFIKEAKTLRRTMIQNLTFTPQIGFPSPILKGITATPPLHGYVLTSLKPRAQSVLEVKLEGEDKEQIDPLLAVWRYGVGSAAAFTSDYSPNWAADWLNWGQRKALLHQLVTEIARVEQQRQLHAWCELEGDEGVITVEDHHPEATFLTVRAEVTGPSQKSQSAKFTQIGPRRYQARVPLSGRGRYQALIEARGDGRQERTYSGWVVPYSPEYLRFRANPIVLNRIRQTTQGEQLEFESADDVIYGRRAPKRSSRQIFDWLVLALACLLPVDVAIRRIQIDPWAIRQMFGFGKGSSSATMGTLLQRKRDVRDQLDGDRRGHATARSDGAAQTSVEKLRTRGHVTGARGGLTPGAAVNSPSPKRSTPPANQTSADAPEKTQESMSTTERLLKIKRQRDEKENRPDHR